MTETDDPSAAPIKVCRKCSVQSTTVGEFCPNCGRSYTRRGVSSRTKWVAGSLAGLLLIAGGGTAIALKVRHDNALDADRAAQVAAERRADDAAQEKADARAEADAQAAEDRRRRIAAKEAAARAEKASRRELVRQMEVSITKDAKERVARGELEGPIYYTTCDPLGGGSTDDLTALTTTFECLAINTKNDDGTVEGWVFSSTANWNKGSWSWHLGR